MNTEQTALSGIIPEGDQLSLDLPPAPAPGFVHERDDTAEIYCARAAARMKPREAFEAVLGSNVANFGGACTSCKTTCYG